MSKEIPNLDLNARVKAILGDLVLQVATLQAQLDAANREIAELKAPKE